MGEFLPLEIWILVFKDLKHKDLGELRLTCQKLEYAASKVRFKGIIKRNPHLFCRIPEIALNHRIFIHFSTGYLHWPNLTTYVDYILKFNTITCLSFNHNAKKHDLRQLLNLKHLYKLEIYGSLKKIVSLGPFPQITEVLLYEVEPLNFNLFPNLKKLHCVGIKTPKIYDLQVLTKLTIVGDYYGNLDSMCLNSLHLSGSVIESFLKNVPCIPNLILLKLEVWNPKVLEHKCILSSFPKLRNLMILIKSNFVNLNLDILNNRAKYLENGFF